MTDIVTPLLLPMVPAIKQAFLGGGAVAVVAGLSIWSLKKGWLLFKDLLGNDRVRDMTWDYAGRIADMDAAMGTADDGFNGDSMQGHTMADYGDISDSGWSQEQENADESGESGAWEQSAQEQDAAASSYLDRYR